MQRSQAQKTAQASALALISILSRMFYLTLKYSEIVIVGIGFEGGAYSFKHLLFWVLGVCC